MAITKTIEGSEATITIEGWLDTQTAPELAAALAELDGSVKSLTLDLAALEYISSAGLRVLLSAQKLMNKQGEMTITHVNDVIMEIFDVTGFTDILTIK
jgi:anti-sigma B factor antagonist